MWQPDFPSWLCRAWKSLAVSTLASGGGSATKKVPQAPESRQLRRLPQGVLVGTAWPHCGAFASFPKNLTNAWQLPSRGNKRACNWLSRYSARLQVVPHFSSGIVEWAKCERAWKSSHVRKGNTRQGERKMRDPHFSLSPSRVAFSRIHGVIFMRTHVFLALLSLRDYTRSLYSADQLSGTPNNNFRKISVRKTIWNLEFSEHLL